MQHPLYYSTSQVFLRNVLHYYSIFTLDSVFSRTLFLQNGTKAAGRSPLHALQLPEQESDLDHILHLRIGKSLVKGLDQDRSIH